MKASKDPKLAIIIVNFNSGNFLLDCLASLEDSFSKINLDIWVVDNASLDDSLKRAEKSFPNIYYIKNSENLGFGAANNIALKRINSEYILLLNPDCELSFDTLNFMFGFMKDNYDVGASSCKVEKSDGSIDWAAHRGFPTPWASFLYFVLGNDSLYHLTSENISKTHQVDAISGAFFMTKKSVLDKVGLFDEDYFLYAEDLDLCFRIKKAGFKIMYVPDVAVLHHKGISSGIKKHSKDISTFTLESQKKALDSFYKTMKIFYNKHLENQYSFLVNWLVYLGINLSWQLAKIRKSV